MNIYRKKVWWKLTLLFSAILIASLSIYYTNILVNKLKYEERKKIEQWAEATSLIVNSNVDGKSLQFLLSVIQHNETVPVIVIDKDTNLIQYRNIDTNMLRTPQKKEKLIEMMMEDSQPIKIQIAENEMQHLYYTNSTILTSLAYYPWVQLCVILLFVMVAYFAFSSSRKAEQNQVWVGLSKETAHQLGTPISSLMAWIEMLKMSKVEVSYIQEIEKDVDRLKRITDRFSKIGSAPVLKHHNIVGSINNTLTYLRHRSSKQVKFIFDSNVKECNIMFYPPLFEWVIENLCKNAIDASNGIGNIHISLHENTKHVYIDIKDQGKGIPKSIHNTIFKPGFTTKSKGWGLGLSLSKRIIEEYHKGKISVASSEPGKGTTFRITLKK